MVYKVRYIALSANRLSIELHISHSIT